MQLATALDSASAACAAWRKAPSPESAEALAGALDELNGVTRRHLEDEEQKIVALASLTLTQEEWNDVGKHGFDEIPRDKRGVALGLLLEPLNEADRAYIKANVPAPVRILRAYFVGKTPSKSGFGDAPWYLTNDVDSQSFMLRSARQHRTSVGGVQSIRRQIPSTRHRKRLRRVAFAVMRCKPAAL